MLREQITIINQLGLHTRAAAKLVATASQFASNIEIVKNKQTGNCKSIMSIILLGITKGTQLDLIVDGPDEQAAREAIVALIQDRFNEKE